MMKMSIQPSRAAGTAAAPPSKSMAHRLLICAGLAKGESVVTGIAPSQDVLATLDCLSALGARYEYEGDCVRMLRGVRLNGHPDSDAAAAGVGTGEEGGRILPCRECGSTLRFFVPLALQLDAPVQFTGSETLLNRPLSVYEEICRENGFLFERNGNGLMVRGNLQPGTYRIPGSISSQFVSGLLFALPLCKGETCSTINLIPPVQSRPYIDMTIQALAAFGVRVLWENETTLRIPGGQAFEAGTHQVEGDYSNAAFLEAFNLAGGAVRVTGLNPDSLQADAVYREYFAALQRGTPELDLSDCPDLGPVMMAAAAMLHGAVFTGTRRLAIKESDRGAAMREELARFGVPVYVEEDRIRVEAAGRLRAPAEELNGHNDHRIVMALCLPASVTGGTITGAQAVQKSFPDFWEEVRRLGIKAEEIKA